MMSNYKYAQQQALNPAPEVQPVPVMATAVCPRCRDRQFVKKQGGVYVFHAHSAKGSSPRTWCRESGQQALGEQIREVQQGEAERWR